MQIDPAEHRKHPWRVHDLLTDFEIEDVWRFPVELDPTQTLAMFEEQFQEAMEELGNKGPASFLFKLRLFIGRVLGWDQKPPPVLLRPGSLRERYAGAESLAPEQLPPPGEGDFAPVYRLVDESLAEIENATVHAALHLSRVPLSEDTATIHMAVYVKPKGIVGRAYMALIKPFRLLIVYPAFMKMMARRWRRFRTIER